MHKQIKKIKVYLIKNKKDIFIFSLFLFFSSWLMYHTFAYSDGNLLIAGKAWSDFAAHIPLIRSFSMGNNFPPEYPTYPGAPIRYHYLFYLIVGMLEKYGVPLVIAFNGLSIFGFTLLLSMIYKTTQLVFRNTSAGLLAVILFLFNGSLSFLSFFSKNPLHFGTPLDIVSSPDFASFGPWDGGIVSAFWTLNIYTNQRHLALSFALVLLVLYPLLKTLFEKSFTLTKKWYAIVWIGFAVFPLLHQAGFVIAGIFTVGLLFTQRLHSTKIFKIYAIGLIISLISFLQFYPYIFTSGDSTSVRIIFGFLSQDKDFISIARYWIHNIGIYFLLIPVFFFWLIQIFSKKKENKNNRVSLIVYFSLFIVLFVILNILQLSADMINNHKLVNFFMIGMVMGTAGMIVELWRKDVSYRFVLAPLIFLLIFSGVIDIFPIINDNKYHIADYTKAETATWIKENTEPESVVLSTTYLYNPAILVGRKNFLDYGYFAWSMGYNDKPRRMSVPSIFSSSISLNQWCTLMHDSEIDYVLTTRGSHNMGDEINIDASMLRRDLIPVFSGRDGYQVYSVAKECKYAKEK